MTGEALFATGDIKWRGLRLVSGNRYELKDLYKGYDQFGKVTLTEYRDSILILQSDGSITTRLFAKGNEEFGTEQRWNRIDRSMEGIENMTDLIWVALFAVLVVVPLWRICGRAGFSPALSLLAIIPWLGFLIIAAVLGFAEWPNLKNRQKSQGS
jgi:hypothetical protein